MGFKKRETSRTVEEAKTRLSGMEQLNTGGSELVEYGQPRRSLTSETFKAQIALCEKLKDDYNKLLEQVDAIGNRIDAEETKLRTMHSEVLLGAKAKFGLDSSEVEMLGGTRSSERKKPRKAKTVK